MVLKLWDDEDGRRRIADDPVMQATLRDAGFPEPHGTGYEVLDHGRVAH